MTVPSVPRPAQPRWRSVIAVFAAASLAIGLAGCSGTGTGSSEPTTATMIDGGTVTQVTTGLSSLDPQGTAAQDTGTSTIAKAVFSRLVVPDGTNFTAQLALEWSQSTDGLTWTFALDPKAKFSDNTPVTAADVKASLQRVIDLKGVNASLFSAVNSIEATSANALVIRTKTAVGTMLYSLSLLYVAPADRLNQEGFWNKPIGSGPFQVESFSVGDEAVLVRNPNYWGTKAHLEKVVLTVIPEVSGRITALQNGEVDIVTNVPQDQVASVNGMNNSQIVSSDSLSILSLWFNNSRAPFTDVRVRQAMWHAVNWDSIQTNLYGETASAGRAPIGSGVFGFAAQTPYAYDQAKAKQLLADAGLPNGFTTSIKFVPSAVPQLQSALEAAASDWAKVGITVNLLPLEQAVWSKDLTALDWDMTALLNTSRTADADQILGRLYTTSAKRLGFANAEYDALVQHAATVSDQAQRAADYAKAIQILWTQAAGIWPLELPATYGINKRVLGFVPDPSSVPDYSAVGVSG